MTEFLAFVRDEAGASAAEYALILAIVGGAIALAAWQLGVSIGVSVNNTATCLKTKVC